MGRLAGRGLPNRLRPVGSRLRAVSDPAARAGADEGAARRSKDWLNTSRWQRLRREVLLRDRYTCRQTGVALVGTYPAPNSAVVDHVVPHRGDPALFWDPENLQAVSKAWHDSVKQSIEKGGRA